MKKCFAGFGLFIAGGLCALALVRPAVVGTPANAQGNAPLPPPTQAQSEFRMSDTGRYQLVISPSSSPFVIDTATGRVWRNDGANNWQFQGGPGVSKLQGVKNQ